MKYVISRHSVSSGREVLSAAQSTATVLGLGRVALGAVFLVAPVLSTRVLGVDHTTAERISFLARMTAMRDIALGAGTLYTAAKGPGRACVPWLLAGAGSDAVDAAVIGAALRRGGARGPSAGALVAGALAAAATGVRAARSLSSAD
jgi:hypothetical protein